MIKKDNKLILYLSSLILPVILLLFVFSLHDIFPFGDKTVMTGDMEYQFTDYLAYLKTIVFGNNDFSYSFSKNLGGSMAGFSAYYFYSPLNYITLFFPNELLPAAETVIVLLTAALSSLSMSILLAERFEGDLRSLIFSIAYALCGFSATYFQLIMYSGDLILFPLIILGFLRLFENPDKKLLYLATLTAAIIFNYYFAFMICIFLFLLFLGECLSLRADRERIRAFIITSLEAVLLSSFVLIPAVRSLFGEKNSLSLGLHRNFLLRSLPRQFFAASFKGDIGGGLPNVFCGTLTLGFFAVFLLSKKIPLREKLIALGLCAFLILNFWISILNVAWHGFNQPIGFPYRYSYMLSFVLILCAHKAFLKVFDAGAGDGEATCPKASDRGAFGAEAGGEASDRKASGGRRGLARIGIVLLLLLIQTADLTYNYYDLLKYFNLASFSEYREYLKETEERLFICREDSRKAGEDNGMYRLEKYFRRTNNDAMQFDYAGLSHFSSSEKKDKINFLGKLGFRNNGNWSFYNESTTDFLECFLGIRYILSQYPSTPNFYERLLKDDDICVFKNENALPLMFNTSENIRDINYNAYNGDPFLLQEAIADSLNGMENRIFERGEILSFETENLTSKREGEYTVYEKKDRDRDASVTICVKARDHESNLFAYFDAPEIQEVEIFRRDVPFGEYFSRYRWNIISFHRTKKDEITVSICPKGDRMTLGQLCFCFEDREKVKSLMDEVKSAPSELRKITSSHLTGSISVPEGGRTVTLTIPFDRGWRIYVDGKRAENKPAAGILLSFDTTPGEHGVEMRYIPEGMIAGRIISFITLVGMILIWRLKKQTNGRGTV